MDHDNTNLWFSFKTLCASLGEKAQYLQKTGFKRWQQDAARRNDEPCILMTGITLLTALFLAVHNMHVLSLIHVRIFCICLKGTELFMWDENPMQSLAGQHCKPLWYHNITQHCILLSTFSGGNGTFLSEVLFMGRFLASVFISPSLLPPYCGKACSRILSCRIYDVRLCQMDCFAC